jgi:hypothetical protein
MFTDRYLEMGACLSAYSIATPVLVIRFDVSAQQRVYMPPYYWASGMNLLLMYKFPRVKFVGYKIKALHSDCIRNCSLRNNISQEAYMRYYRKVPALGQKSNAGLTYSILPTISFKTVPLDVRRCFKMSSLQFHFQFGK